MAELGHVRRLTGDIPGALRELRRALNLLRRIGVHGKRAWALNHYAAAIISSGDYDRGVRLHHEALHLARQMRQPIEQARALAGIGEAHLRIGDTKAGIARLEHAVEIFRHLSMHAAANPVQDRLTTLTPPSGG
jgi:tetratricopeptide (TPR) repeat protein